MLCHMYYQCHDMSDSMCDVTSDVTSDCMPDVLSDVMEIYGNICGRRGQRVHMGADTGREDPHCTADTLCHESELSEGGKTHKVMN